MSLVSGSVMSPSVLTDLVARPSHPPRADVVDASLVLAGVAVVALLAKVSFFIGPVPITGQTLGVLIVGATLGAKRGAIALLAYIFVGLAGLPVFAGPTAGPAYVLMPSFGFVLGFVIAAFVAGWMAEHAWDRNPLLAFVGFGCASAMPFLVGVPYMVIILSAVMGQELTVAGVLDDGVWPFVIPGLIKAAFAAVIIPGAWLLVRAADRTKR